MVTTESKSKDKNISESKTKTYSKKELNRAILELSKEANKNITKRMFKDLIGA